MALKGVGLGGTKTAVQAIQPSIAQRLDFTGVSAQSTALDVATEVVQLFCTQDCFIAMGANPTAVVDGATSFFVPGGIVHYFIVHGGWKIAAIQSTAPGTLRIIEALSA